MGVPKTVEQLFDELAEQHPEWGNEKRLAQAVLFLNRKMAENGEREELTKKEEDFFESFG